MEMRKPVNRLEDALYTKYPLRFGQDGKFRILMVSDIHGGVGYAEKETVDSMQELVDRNHPNLVILGGDTAGPGRIHVENEAALHFVLDGITSPMEKAGIPWAHVYGNHDNNFGLPNERQQAVYEAYPHCISKAGPEEISGVGNYVLPVWDASGKEILWNLFCLDSHRGMTEFAGQCGFPEDTEFLDPEGGRAQYSPGMVYFDQIMWYWETSKALEQYMGGRIPALMFLHIPLREHKLVLKNREACGFTGNQLGEEECPPLNNGLFSACLQRGDVKGIFCGHVHLNDFCGKYCGIMLGHDGYMSYHACHEKRTRGGRVFEITAGESEFVTYMSYV